MLVILDWDVDTSAGHLMSTVDIILLLNLPSIIFTCYRLPLSRANVSSFCMSLVFTTMVPFHDTRRVGFQRLDGDRELSATLPR